MTTFSPHRRQFLRGTLQGLGGVSVGLPLLSSLLPRTARAAPGDTPRLVVMMVPHGSLVEDRFFSSRAPANVSMRADGSSFRYEALANFYSAGEPFAPGGTNPHVLSPLEPFKAKVNVIKGLDIPYYLGHHRGGPLLGHPLDNDQGSAVNNQLSGRPTLDQFLAQRIYPNTFRGYRSLVFGSSMSFDRIQPGNPNSPVGRLSDMGNDAIRIYRAIFGIYDTGGLSNAAQGDLLNFVHQDYQSLRNHSRLSSSDKQLLESHMTMLADLGNRIRNPPADLPPPPTSCESTFSVANCSSEQRLRFDYQTQNSIVAAAIRTGLTRVASKYLDRYTFDGGYWHDHAHNATQVRIQDEFQETHRWFMANVLADLLAKLDVPEANGRTYLDNSLVVWHHEHSWTHSLISVPTVVAGSGGGALRTGWYVDYTDQRDVARASGQQYWNDPYSRTGIYLHQLHASVFSAFGVPVADYQAAPGQGYMEVLNLADPRYVGGATAPRTNPAEKLPYLHL